MNIIKKLFGINKNETTATELMNTPSKELFIDDSFPYDIMEEETQKPQSVKSDLISDFLDIDYYQLGVNEGFSTHSNESAQSRKKLIKSQFRNLLNSDIERKKEVVLQLENSGIDVADISMELKEKLENKIHYLNKEIEDLKEQKLLSSQDEGKVMSAIHQYHQGFLSGLKNYLEMKKILTVNS